MGTEAERKDARKAMMTDFRLIIKQADKDRYTKEELYDLIDTVILAMDQET